MESLNGKEAIFCRLSAKNGFLNVETFHVIVLPDESGQEAESLGQSWQEAIDCG